MTGPPKTVAEAYLSLLHSRGVERLFANAGTDFAPLIEALARGVAAPEVVAVPHETVAVGMAHGYYLRSGRPQAVMVHVNVGVANALVGLMNASRAGVPILFTSGRTPYTERGHLGSRDLPIHWGQEMFDQGGLVREHAKWQYELTYGDQVEELVDRALAIAMAHPRGPVYLSLPREALAAPWGGGELSTSSLQAAPSPPHPEPAAVARAADLLAAAERPLIVSSWHEPPEADFELSALAERFALPVVEHWPPRLALATDHPMHAGFDPGPRLADADVVLVLDARVPWIPSRHSRPDGQSIVEVSADPTFADQPLRGHPATLSITATASAAVKALTEALASRVEDAGIAERLAVRRAAVAEENERQRADRRRPAASAAALSRPFIDECLAAAKGDDTIVVNELGCDPARLDFRRPGTYFGISVAGGLGWGLPAALGIQLAAPDRVVMATVGDGSLVFANPVACHQVAERLRLPVLTVVFNNAGWDSVRQATRALYPDGAATARSPMPLTSLAPSPDFARVIEASNGYGERVERAAELPAALERALQVVREERRQALVDVVLE